MNRNKWRGIFSLALLILGVVGKQMPAVVVATTTGNVSAPDDDPGWANVGIRGSATAVYVGNGWVLTAAHVGAGDVEFPELHRLFAVDPATAPVPLRNPADLGLSATTDLMLFKLAETPELPPLVIASSRPNLGGEVVMIGHGLDREPVARDWDLRSTSASAPAIWTEVPRGTGQFHGFNAMTESSMRWGVNSIDFLLEPTSTTPLGINGHVFSFATDFDFARNQAQAVTNDSGGAVFAKRDGTWELAGIMVAVNGFPGQKIQEMVLFGNQTLSADLSIYRDQIVSLVPEPFFHPGLILAWGIQAAGMWRKGRARAIAAGITPTLPAASVRRLRARSFQL